MLLTATGYGEAQKRATACGPAHSWIIIYEFVAVWMMWTQKKQRWAAAHRHLCTGFHRPVPLLRIQRLKQQIGFFGRDASFGDHTQDGHALFFGRGTA